MSPTNILILAAGCLVIGIVLDNLVRLLFKPEKPAEAKPTTPKSPAAPAPVEGQVEIVRLWQEAGTQALLVETGGKSFHRAQELSPELRVQLKSALERLSNWMEIPLPAAEKQVAAAPVISTPASWTVAPAADYSQPIKRSGLNPLDVIVNALDSDVVKPDTTKSLAQQVDAVLQEKLAGSPLRDKGIRLLDVPGKGLVVMVGMEKYDGVEAVPDEQVKAVLRSAVDEWAKRAGSWKA